MSEDDQGFNTETTGFKYAHDVNLERKGVESLLECDDLLVREVTLLRSDTVTVDGSSPQAKTAPVARLPVSKHGSKHKTGAYSVNNESFFTGWGPHGPPLAGNGKQNKDNVSKHKESRSKENSHRHSRDYKYKCSKDSFVFRHYRDTRKYMEQYRSEHACGATIHISKRVLSARSSQKLQGFPSNVNVYHVYSPSHVRKSDSFSRDNRDQLPEHRLDNSQLPNSWWTNNNSGTEQQSTKQEKSTKIDENNSSRTPRMIDPAIVFKYKLAPNYVQNILQQQKKLLKQQSGLDYNSEINKIITDGTHDNTEKDYDKDLGSVEVRGRVCSATQSISSRGKAGVNLAPTKISFSSLPSVPVIVSQSTNQTPISALAENVVVKQTLKRTEPTLPGGGLKTLENLTTFTGGEKQMWFDTRGRAYVSLATRYEPKRDLRDMRSFPWKENVGILKGLSEEKKHLSVLSKITVRSSSFILPGIQEGVSYDDELHSQGFRSSPVRRRPSQVSGISGGPSAADSVSGRSSTISGILSKMSFFNTNFSGKGSSLREDSIFTKQDNGINFFEAEKDFVAEAANETDILHDRLTSHGTVDTGDNLQTDQPKELNIKPLQPKSKMELLFFPRITKNDTCLVHNEKT